MRCSDRARAGDPHARVISVTGAREHNLKNVDLMLPRDRLVVFTGLSGSGKSSLAFDTIYAEGQRRYVESLSAYARQFLEMMQKPDVDQIDGLSPAISIEQKTTSKNPRSTVGTVTEIYDYMRLLWARVGIPYSPATGLPIESQTVSQNGRQGTRPAGEDAALSARAGGTRAQGRVSQGIGGVPEEGLPARQDRRAASTRSTMPPPSTRNTSTISTWWSIASWCATTWRRAWPNPSRRRSNSPTASPSWNSPTRRTTRALRAGSSSRRNLPARFPEFTIPEIEPRLFSFNNPTGACPECDGIGHEMRIDPALIVPDPPRASLKKGAIAPWAKSTSPYYGQTLEADGEALRVQDDRAMGRDPGKGA